MNDIRIFMCCHNGYEIIPPLCEPIQCGAALNPVIPGILHDNEGENISRKNREYCELTAHFFAWKNISAEYYGFCHYRRFFCADESTKKPYFTLGKLSDSRPLGNENRWRELISKHEIIAPRSEDMGLSVREHYRTSKFHYAEDLEFFLKTIEKKSPRLVGTTERYLAQNRQYFCNMFIMDKAHFFDYCEILFSALDEFDRRKTLHGDFQSDRTDGYLGEIFTGIYINYCRENAAKIKELPRLDVGCSVRKRISRALLPPESKRRFVVKAATKKLKG